MLTIIADRFTEVEKAIDARAETIAEMLRDRAESARVLEEFKTAPTAAGARAAAGAQAHISAIDGIMATFAPAAWDVKLRDEYAAAHVDELADILRAEVASRSVGRAELNARLAQRTGELQAILCAGPNPAAEAEIRALDEIGAAADKQIYFGRTLGPFLSERTFQTLQTAADAAESVNYSLDLLPESARQRTGFFDKLFGRSKPAALSAELQTA